MVRLLKVSIILLLLASCNPVKKLQKEEAFLSDLRAKWNAAWVAEHPCPLPGPIDLDSLCEVLQTEKAAREGIDTSGTLHDPGTEPFYLGTIPFHTYMDTSRRTAIRTIYKDRLVPWEDTRTITALKGKVTELGIDTAILSQRSRDFALQLAEAKKEKNKWLWWFIGATVAFGLTGAGLLKRLFI